jgi:hypothetical protein
MLVPCDLADADEAEADGLAIYHTYFFLSLGPAAINADRKELMKWRPISAAPAAGCARGRGSTIPTTRT